MTLDEVLKEKDLHRAQLARRVGVDRSQVGRWARGEVKPHIETLPKIAKALDMTTDQVIEMLTNVKEKK